ncbi:hypothetical protein GCM10029964_069110 [Kibdelosporangium lantanae]
MGTAEGGEGRWEQAGSGDGEPAQADGGVFVGEAGEFPGGGVDLVDHARGPAHHDLPGRGEPYAVVAAFQQGCAGRAFQGRDLPGDGRLGVVERCRRGGERAALGHLPEDAQRGE